MRRFGISNECCCTGGRQTCCNGCGNLGIPDQIKITPLGSHIGRNYGAAINIPSCVPGIDFPEWGPGCVTAVEVPTETSLSALWEPSVFNLRVNDPPYCYVISDNGGLEERVITGQTTTSNSYLYLCPLTAQPYNDYIICNKLSYEIKPVIFGEWCWDLTWPEFCQTKYINTQVYKSVGGWYRAYIYPVCPGFGYQQHFFRMEIEFGFFGVFKGTGCWSCPYGHFRDGYTALPITGFNYVLNLSNRPGVIFDAKIDNSNCNTAWIVDIPRQEDLDYFGDLNYAVYNWRALCNYTTHFPNGVHYVDYINKSFCTYLKYPSSLLIESIYL